MVVDFIPQKLNKMRPIIGLFARYTYLVFIVVFTLEKVKEYLNKNTETSLMWAVFTIVLLSSYVILVWRCTISLTNEGFTKRSLFSQKQYFWNDVNTVEEGFSMVGTVSLILTMVDGKKVKLAGAYFEHHKIFNDLIKLSGESSV